MTTKLSFGPGPNIACIKYFTSDWLAPPKNFSCFFLALLCSVRVAPMLGTGNHKSTDKVEILLTVKLTITFQHFTQSKNLVGFPRRSHINHIDHNLLPDLLPILLPLVWS